MYDVDENLACFIEIEAELIKIIASIYPLMKTTWVSFKWNAGLLKLIISLNRSRSDEKSFVKGKPDE